MVYKKFFINVIVQILLLVINSFVITYIIMNYKYYHAIIALSGVFCFQVYYLIFYVNRTNRYLSRFFLSLREQGSSFYFQDNEDTSSFGELNRRLSEINDIIKNTRIEKEGKHNYLNNIVEHVGVGLISFNEKGKVEFINSAAKGLLGITYLADINSLNKLKKDFANILRDLKPDQQKLVKIVSGEKLLQLSIRAAEFKLLKNNIKLVSLQDINSELDRNELDSWQKLIRVLAHEIMSSVSPITSLSSAMIGYLSIGDKPKSTFEIKNENIKDAINGLNIIKRRGEGLVTFVDNYRSLTQLPEINCKTFFIKKLFQDIGILLNKDIKESNINVKIEVHPESLQLYADEKQVEQILINLIKNSIHAIQISKKRSLILRSFVDIQERIVIQVTDNGKGITNDEADKVFIPFYTTKENGSGIGLSISKQIMRLHGGTISFKSTPGGETVFSLRF